MVTQSARFVRRVRQSSGSGPSTGRLAIRRALACFAAAYLIVTVLAAATTLIYGTINNTLGVDKTAASPAKAPSFAATVPYHVLIMLAIWPVFAWLYFRRPNRATADSQVRETLLLSVFWLLAAMLVDFVGFVVVKNPWSLSVHQFYVDYQPWITLIYVAIALSPWIRLLVVRFGTPHANTRSAHLDR
jgi:hypothetical protein